MDASGLLHAETEDEGDGEGTQDLIWDQAGQSEMPLPASSHAKSLSDLILQAERWRGRRAA